MWCNAIEKLANFYEISTKTDYDCHADEVLINKFKVG